MGVEKSEKKTFTVDEKIRMITASHIRGLFENCLIVPKNKEGEISTIVLEAMLNRTDATFGKDIVDLQALEQRANYILNNNQDIID